MLFNTLSTIPAIALLRSDKLLHKLLQVVIGKEEATDLCASKTLENAVRDFYPNRFRKGDMLTAIMSIHVDMDKVWIDYGFDALDDLFKEYFCIDGSLIYAKEDNLERYSVLINKVHPFCIIGRYLSRSLRRGFISMEDIRLFATHCTPLALERGSTHEQYAENHLHLGGAIESPINVFSMLSAQKTNNKWYSGDVFENLPRLSEFSLIHDGAYSFGLLLDCFKEISCAINSYTLHPDHRILAECAENISLMIGAGQRRDHLVGVGCDFVSLVKLNDIAPFAQSNTASQLLALSLGFFSKHRYDKAWFVYLILLFWLHDDECSPPQLRRYIKIFLHISNIFRSYIVMSGNVGLEHFSEFFNSDLRYMSDGAHRCADIAATIVSGGTTHIEGKISPDQVIGKGAKGLFDWKESFDDAIIEERKQNKVLSLYPFEARFLDMEKRDRVNGFYEIFGDPSFDAIRYQFSIHFIRKPDKEKFSLEGLMPPRHHELRKEIKKQALKLDKFLRSADNKHIALFEHYSKRSNKQAYAARCEELLEGCRLDATALIVSLDVAGKEGIAPPEVFAPVMRFLRRQPQSIKSSLLPASSIAHTPRLKISAHAGEDFNHLVSGMRKVDETVLFYEMGRDDRLGHALAIGLDPKQWIERSGGELLLTLEEMLDNCVWLWQRGIELAERYEKAMHFVKLYEIRIRELSHRVYGRSSEPNTLLEAWKFRHCCPVEMMNGNETLRDVDEYYAASTKCKREEVYGIFHSYHVCTNVRKNGAKPLRVIYRANHNSVDSSDEFGIDDMISYRLGDTELEFYRALQDMLIERYAKIGLIVEACPSSNVYIANLQSYAEHPIFRWFPVRSDWIADKTINFAGIRQNRLKVCINSDDPAIFPTTLPNEYRLLKEAMKSEFRVGELEADDWIERVRKIGIEAFEVSHKTSVTI